MWKEQVFVTLDIELPLTSLGSAPGFKQFMLCLKIVEFEDLSFTNTHYQITCAVQRLLHQSYSFCTNCIGSSRLSCLPKLTSSETYIWVIVVFLFVRVRILKFECGLDGFALSFYFSLLPMIINRSAEQLKQFGNRSHRTCGHLVLIKNSNKRFILYFLRQSLF
ncbi:Uncharacterised protein [Chlamydia trachomatis]|nr:Uncharacterised protein [Chlamydia trachomatis]